MNRNYTTSEFAEKINKLHKIIPKLAIGIDVITGFPGETDELFSKTEKFLSELDFTYLHVFSYSRRPGTKAAEMKNQVNGRKINYRSNRLIDLSKNKTEKYLEKILKNKIVLSGIVENQIDGYWTALSDHYLRIYLKNNDNLLGKYLKFEPKEKKFNGVEVTMCKLRNS